MDECEECVRLFRRVVDHTAPSEPMRKLHACQWCAEGETCGKVNELWAAFQAHRERGHGGESHSQASTD